MRCLLTACWFLRLLRAGLWTNNEEPRCTPSGANNLDTVPLNTLGPLSADGVKLDRNQQSNARDLCRVTSKLVCQFQTQARKHHITIACLPKALVQAEQDLKNRVGLTTNKKNITLLWSPDIPHLEEIRKIQVLPRVTLAKDKWGCKSTKSKAVQSWSVEISR